MCNWQVVGVQVEKNRCNDKALRKATDAHGEHLAYYSYFSTLLMRALRCKAAVDGLVVKVTVQWPLNNDLLHPPQHWLTSHMPLWSDTERVDIISQWHDDWSSASVVNCDLVHDPTIHSPGFSLPRKQWCTLNCFRTNQGHFATSSGVWLIATYVSVVPLRQCLT